MFIAEKQSGGNIPETRIEKTFGALLVKSTATLDQLKQTNIDVFVQRNDGDDYRIATSLPLDKFMKLSVAGDSNIYGTPEFPTIAICEISEGGAIELDEKDGIVIALTNLPANTSTRISGIESPERNPLPVDFEQKVIQQATTTQTLQTEDFDLMMIDNIDVLRDVQLRYENNVTTKHTPEELKAMSQDLDPVVQTMADGTVVQQHTGEVIIPVSYVESIDFTKSTTGVVNVTFKKFNALDEEFDDDLEA